MTRNDSNDKLSSTARWQTDKPIDTETGPIHQNWSYIPCFYVPKLGLQTRVKSQANEERKAEMEKKTSFFFPPWPMTKFLGNATEEHFAIVSPSEKIGGKKKWEFRWGKIRIQLWNCIPHLRDYRGPIKENDASSTESGFFNPFKNIPWFIIPHYIQVKSAWLSTIQHTTCQTPYRDIGRTDRQTDSHSCRDARTHLKWDCIP